MTYAAGALSVKSTTSTGAALTSAAATGGTGPYTYQWYRSTTSAFTPASSLAISGATALTYSDTALAPAVVYYYEVVATDTGNANALASSAQLKVITQSAQQQNQFAQSVIMGNLDMKFNSDVISAQIDTSSAGSLLPGQAVVMVNSADGIPKVVESTAVGDSILGYICYNQKDIKYNVGDKCEVAMGGCVINLVAVGVIARGAQCQNDLTYIGGVKTSTGSSGATYIGWALDAAAAQGQTIRVYLKTPSFTTF